VSHHRSFDYDVLVLGGGSAGYAAARTASARGLRTGVVEGGSQVGGLCILRGCMPTKALLYAAEVRHLSQTAGLWGMKPGQVPFRWDAVMARKDELIREFADYRVQQLNAGAFDFLRAMARFSDPHTVILDNGRRLTAGHFVLSTGSVVAQPPLAPLTEVGFLTSDDLLELRQLPKSLLVLGGGSVGMEFAQTLARFDVEVTLIQRSPHVLKEFDPDATSVLETVLRREGVRLFTGTRLVDAYRDQGAKVVTFVHDERKMEVRADEILMALGRSPNTAVLALDLAGVLTEQGRIITDLRMRTNVPHIYAAGDCTSPHEIVHLAVAQGEIAAHNIARPDQPRSMDYRLLTTVVFTEPQLACVGLTERVAQAEGIPYLAASYPFADHGKSLIMEARDGHVKLLADPQRGELLGGACVGPLAGELIHEIIVAMGARLTVRQLATLPHYHPTLAEIWTYPAEELAEKIPVPPAPA
jgi:pyruvate/2-oxoglutarate dehydrogenase complex dihydrolipoamide dehydrogenase (E3) component